MDKYGDPTATPAGEFTDGNPALEIPRTVLRATWPNMVQRELIAVVEGAGLALNGALFTQLFEAIVLLAKSNGTPVGTVSAFVRQSAPAGWLPLIGGTVGDAVSGSSVLASAAAEELFTVLWENFPNSILQLYDSGGLPVARAGSAAADFVAHRRIATHDLRGEFVRGWDWLRGVDPSRVLGSGQEGMVGQHQHLLLSMTAGNNGPNPENYLSHYRGDFDSDEDYQLRASGSPPSACLSSGGTGTETRPRNVALLYCVKY